MEGRDADAAVEEWTCAPPVRRFVGRRARSPGALTDELAQRTRPAVRRDYASPSCASSSARIADSMIGSSAPFMTASRLYAL